jgi:hypothetical protein
MVAQPSWPHIGRSASDVAIIRIEGELPHQGAVDLVRAGFQFQQDVGWR